MPGRRARFSWMVAAGLAVALASVQFVTLGRGAATARPAPTSNVLLITVDTLRADRAGIYGFKHVPTPNMDLLAAQSVVFSRAFTHVPMTLPAHTNILLGATPLFHGVHDNVNFVVRGEFLTLAEHLKGQGYATGAFIGGFPLDSYFGLDQGFDVYDDAFGSSEKAPSGASTKEGERPAAAVWARAREWLQTARTPWFLWVHFYDPHDPYEPPEPYRTRFAGSLYDGEVAYVDAILKDFMEDLDSRNLADRTLVVFTGDHGESLGDHGEQTHGYLGYNTTLWVPLFIRAPGLDPGIVRRNVSHIDIFPTVCDLLGIGRPDALQGVSLLPLMRGKRAEERPVYFESLSPYFTMGWAPLRGFIDKNEKFIDSPLPELYDLERDFGEEKNLVSASGAAGPRKRLEAIVQSQTSSEGAKAGQAADRATLEKLRSLGYVASLPGPRKTDFGPEDSVAALLPYHNRAADAMRLYKAGKASEAINALREVLTTRKNIRAAYLNLSRIYKEQGRTDDALAVIRLGLEAMPENYDIYFQQIGELSEAGRYDEALQAFEAKGFPQVEFDPVIWNYAGLAFWKTGNVEQALVCFERSLAIDRTFALTYHNLGTVHFDVFRKTKRPESYEAALAAFEKAVALDPGYGVAHFSLGVARFQRGQFARAVESLEKALALDPGLDEAHYFLGSASLEMGDRSKALTQLTAYKASRTYEQLSPAAKAQLESIIERCKSGRDKIQ